MKYLESCESFNQKKYNRKINCSNWEISFKESFKHSWDRKNNCLKKKFIFNDFKEAFNFIKKVAFLANKYNHHPKWTNEYNSVEIELSTHDKGNIITDKDIILSKEIDKLLNK